MNIPECKNEAVRKIALNVYFHISNQCLLTENNNAHFISLQLSVIFLEYAITYHKESLGILVYGALRVYPLQSQLLFLLPEFPPRSP